MWIKELIWFRCRLGAICFIFQLRSQFLLQISGEWRWWETFDETPVGVQHTDAKNSRKCNWHSHAISHINSLDIELRAGSDLHRVRESVSGLARIKGRANEKGQISLLIIRRKTKEQIEFPSISISRLHLFLLFDFPHYSDWGPLSRRVISRHQTILYHSWAAKRVFREHN